jgi:hypothetical protein
MIDLGFDPDCTPASNQREFIDRSWYQTTAKPEQPEPCWSCLDIGWLRAPWAPAHEHIACITCHNPKGLPKP